MPPLAPRDLRLLDGFRLNPRRQFAGRVRGERLTTRKGISIEFSDYRDYAEGDDLRHLDWNVLARLESPVIKTYRDEEDLAVHLLVDLSPSMAFGDPPKARQARHLAHALGYLALASGDAAYPHPLGIRIPPSPPLRGRAAYPRLAAQVDGWPEGTAGGPTLSAELRAFAASRARPGLVLLLSDGMDPDVPGALRILGGRGHEVLFLQILSEVERDPDIEGDLRLIDSESGAEVEVTANVDTLRAYRRNLAAHQEAIAEAVRRGGGRRAEVDAADRLEALVRGPLRRQGWLV